MNLLSKLLILLIISTSLPAHSEDIIKPYEIGNVLVTFFWFDNYEDLQEYYLTKFGDEEDEELVDRRMLGFSGAEPYPEKNICHLDLYTVRPTQVNDRETFTIGHEVLHCVYGPHYHRVLL